MGRRRSALLTCTVAGVLVVSALGVGGQPVAPGRHHDHGRFSAGVEGFPPQPVGTTGARPVTVQAYAAAEVDAVAVAAADARVRRLLGDAAQLIGAAEVGPKDGSAPATEVTWYVPDRVGTVVATVAAGRVAVEEVPAERWQPPLTAAEVDTAIAIARAAWVAEGVDAAAALQGFGMHTMDVDGSYPSTRMAYVTLAAHVDARPELASWVDLTSGAVLRARVLPAGPSPDAPSHLSQAVGGGGAPRAGTVDWEGWTFDYAVSGHMDGVALQDVSYRGVKVLERASMPAMTVFYDDDVCGPFVDRLGGELTPVDWADGAEVVLREVTVLGEPWLELGILDTLGEYVLYQSFYLSPDGSLDAHTFAKGLQCETDHVHYPFWRFDVDLAGPRGDRVRRATASGEEGLTHEFDLPADAAVGHGWSVVDDATGHRVDLAFDDGSWAVPGQVVPEVLYATNAVHGRQYDLGQAGTWDWPAVRDLPDGAGREMSDVVLWYRGFLPHTADEGPDLWHSTGVRLTVELAHFVRSRD